MRKIILLFTVFVILMQTAQAGLAVTDGLCDVTLDARYGDVSTVEKIVTLELKNTGNASITVGEPCFNESSFDISHGITPNVLDTYPFSIPAGASKEVRIGVHVAGTVSEGIHIMTVYFDDIATTIDVDVHRLIPAHLVRLRNIDAGTVVFDNPGKKTPDVNFQIVNNGDTEMIVKSVATYGTPDIGMTFSVDHPSRIAGQSTETATLTITIPASAPEGKHQGKLRIDCGKAGSQTITVTLYVKHAIKVVGEVDIRGEVVDAASQIAPFTWTAQNFASLYYDVDRNLMSDSLTTTVALPNTIESGDLVYTAYRVESSYMNPEIGEYFAIGWFGEKYMAINGKPYVVSPIILEMGEYDTKVLATDEEWNLGNGYSLTATQIDIDRNEVWLSLKKDGLEVYSSVIRRYDHGDWFKNRMEISGSHGAYTRTTEDIQTERTFVYQTDVGAESNVPVFSVYVDAIFRGTTTNIVQLKYAILIDDDPVRVIDDEIGMMEAETITSESVRLESARDITLYPDSDFRIAFGLWLHVAGDLDRNGVRNYRYYPYVRHVCPAPEPTPTPTPPHPPPPPTPLPVDEISVRGEVVELTGAQTGDIVWGATNFAALWYDLDHDLSTETLMIASGTLSKYDRTIEEDSLIYNTSLVYKEYELHENENLTVESRHPDGDTGYYIEGWMADEYVAIDGRADKLAKLLVEFEDDDKKTLATGEEWDLGGGFSLTAQQINLEGDKVWLTLKKNGKELDNEVVSTNGTHQDRVYTYTADIENEEDIPVFSCYVDAVFRGTDTNIVQVMYVFLIDDDVLEIDLGDTYGAMEVVTAGPDEVILINDESTLDLDCDTTEHIMGDMYFKTANDESAIRFYPMVEYTIGSVGIPEVEGYYIFDNKLQVNEGIKIEDDIRIEVVEVKRFPLGCAKFRITSYQKPERTIAVFTGDGPQANRYETYSGIPIYLEVLSVCSDSIRFRVTGPANWRVTDYYTVEEGSGLVEIRGDIVELTGTQTEDIVWDARNFDMFWYDLDDDLMTETMRIGSGTLSASDRRIEEGEISYVTTAADVGFEYDDWGKYKVIGFMAEKYFAGYGSGTEDEITGSGTISLVSKDMLSKVLVDEDEKQMISTGASLDLKEGYELRILQLDIDGNKAQLELLRDGETIDNETVNAPDTYVYRKDLGELDDVPIIAVHLDSIFAGTEADMATIEGIFQISEEYVSVEAGDRYGEMEIRSSSGYTITMKNRDDIALKEGEVIDLMGDIKVLVADSSTLRFTLYSTITEPGTYEVRGTIHDTTETPTWDFTNFEGFYYDIDDDLGTEKLKVKDSGATIHDGNLVYETTAQLVDFDLSRWGSYRVIGFMTEKYFAGYDGAVTDDEITNEDISLISKNMLSKVLIDEEEDRMISTGTSLDLKEGYELRILQLDVDGNKAQLELLRNGECVDTGVIDAPDTFRYRKDLGKLDDVPLIAVHVSNVFTGTETDMATIDGIFQISEDYASVNTGDRYGEMEITSISGDRITMKNRDDVSLEGGEVTMLTGDIGFRVSEDEDRYYLFARQTISGGSGGGGSGTYPPCWGTIPAADADRDGVPDVWDADNSTLPGYRTDSDGSGQMWGDMNGDGVLTSVDALMILQAAADGICL